MTTYYVSPSGSDANNGLGPDASAAVNKPWLTIGKALGAAGINSGDTVYIAPGTYQEVVTVAMTSATVETKVLGDPLNAQGFKDGSGLLLTPGLVRWTAYTTNDKSAPSASNTLSLAGRDFLTFEKIYFVAGDTHIVSYSTAVSTNLTFRNCVFCASSELVTYLVNLTGLIDGSAILFERCSFFGSKASIALYLSSAASTGTGNIGVTVRNCKFEGGSTSYAIAWVNTTVTGNGLVVEGNTMVGHLYGVYISNTAVTQTYPALVRNNLIYACQNALYCASGANAQMVESYNLINASMPRTNVTAGTGSISDGSYSCLLDCGYSLLVGLIPRAPFEPIPGSPVLGFGDGGSFSAEDMWGRIRPSGGASLLKGVGCLELHDFAAKELTTKDVSDAGIVLTGPGDHDILVAVDATSTTISVKGRYDATHNVTTKPQIILLAAPEIGVATETKTMTAAVDTWETLTFSAFTPTAKGWVTIRLVSRPAAGSGKAFFDTLAIA